MPPESTLPSAPKAQISARRAQTRERLLQAAALAVSEKGFNATTLDEIAARAGLTKGAIYDNFSSKNEMFLALLLRRRPGPEWPKTRTGTAKQRLRKLAKTAIAENEANRGMAPLRAEFLLYSLTHPEVLAWTAIQLEQQLARTEAHVRDLFAPEELTLAPSEMAIMIENFVPSLAYTRAWAPRAISLESVIRIFESFARTQT